MGKSFRAGIAVSLILAATAAGACGDKLSAFSRHTNYRGNLAHSAQILLFAPAGSTAHTLAADPQFQGALKKGNHKLRVADSAAQLSSELASGNFDLVLADAGAAAKVDEQMHAQSSSAVFVPVMDSPSKSELRDIEHRYSVVLMSHARSSRYVDILDDAVELRMARSQPSRMARK